MFSMATKVHVYCSEERLLPVSSVPMDRFFSASSALLLFWQLVTGFSPHSHQDFEPVAMPEFNYASYLPDYLYPHAEFQWNPGQYLLMCEVYPKVEDRGLALIRVDKAESLIEMDNGEIKMLMEEAVESKENVRQQQRLPHKKESGRFGAPLSELELNAMSTPFVPWMTK